MDSHQYNSLNQNTHLNQTQQQQQPLQQPAQDFQPFPNEKLTTDEYNLNGRNFTQYTQHFDSNDTITHPDDLRYRSLTKQSTTNRSFMSKMSFVNKQNFYRFTRSKVTFLTINTLVCS